MAEIEHNLAARQITETLKGPVANVFRKMIPGFAEFSGEEFYEAVITNSELLHGCLNIFRKRRDAFDHLLVDDKGRRVGDDFVRLRCGRSVHDIVAMIVRTHAKRHFRETLGGDPNDPASRSGKLYKAMNEYLIHEWQVPLVPHYAPLSPAKVAAMGPLLLELKTAAELDKLSGRAAAATAPISSPAPVVADEPDNSREEGFWWETLNDPLVRSNLGRMSELEVRELTAALCGLGEPTRGRLLGGLGLSLHQSAVLLGTCYRLRGRAGFGQTFGKPGDGPAVADFTAKLQSRGIGSRSDLKSIAKAAEAVVATLPRASRVA